MAACRASQNDRARPLPGSRPAMAKETPATRAATRARVRFAVHKYEHDPSTSSYALQAAGALGVEPARVFKTLVVTLRDGFAVCIVPSDATLDLRALGKNAAMAPVERAERVTGYVAGGISPLGQRRPLPTYLDDSAKHLDTLFVSAGRRGLEIELAPDDLISLTHATVQKLRRDAADRPPR
jgi:Cys-tRNA(Pro)/Cys-tRNA(Cys) deacylase